MTDHRRLLWGAALALALTACDQGGGTAPPNGTRAAEVTAGPATPGSAPSGTVGPLDTLEPEPSPTVGDTGSAGTPPCTLDALKASHGLVEVVAESRLTEVVLVSADTCSVEAFPALVLRDAGGGHLTSSIPLGAGAIDLVPGVVYTSQVTLADWCKDEPAFPLSLGILFAGHELAVTGDSFPDDGDLPGCTGGGPVLTASAWGPTP